MTNRRPHFLNIEGQTATEYAVILALLVLIVMAAIPFLGTSVAQLYTDFTNAFSS